MSKITRIVIFTLLALCTVQPATAQVAVDPVTFQFTFCEGGPSDAQARGWITFDGNAMENPFGDFEGQTVQLPSPLVVDLYVVVSNSAAGNGSFDLNDITSIAWWSNGGTLNFDQELVGQPTDDLPWGTPAIDEFTTGGDFNLFSDAPPAPNGEWYFTLGANYGSGEYMTLVSMVPGPESPGEAVCNIRPTSIPTLDNWGKITLFVLFIGFAGFALRRQLR